MPDAPGALPPPARPRPFSALDADVLPGLVGYDQAALDAAGVSLVIVDARVQDLPVCWVSPAFLQLTGYRAGDVIGRNCRLLQTEHTSTLTRSRIREAIAQGSPLRETLLNRRADGSIFWNELLMTPLRNDAGEVDYLAGYQVDVSARMAAHAAYERFLEAERRARHRQARGVPRTTETSVTLDLNWPERVSQRES
ncbi:PAS domain-containing protein [Kineococcus gynurae]|uniref:PAS domain-containing protein n=1 Tax=Kineococcus gynurae TaxID=452979 RepID=A0ABV5LUI4_9ACTN